MLPTRSALSAALVLLAALAGCQGASRPAATQTAGVAPAAVPAPEKPGCSGEVTRYRAVMTNDLATGNVGRAVHDKISREIDRADSACKAGLETEAVAIIRLAKAQHGYR